MKKKILFIAPDYYGFNKVVSQGLKEYSNHDVIEINSTIPYCYKNIGERIYNFFLKIFTKKNLKNIKRGQHIAQTIQIHDEYDLLIMNRPDVLEEKDLVLAMSRSKISKVIFWDSIEKIPQQINFINRFSEVLSFDTEDCYKYGFKEITNFYFAKKNTSIYNIYDVSLLMTYDKRIHDAIKLFEYFKLNNIKAKARVFTYKSNPIKQILPDGMEVIYEIIPFKESYNYYLDSKIIIDLAHSHQTGLSFRPFEAIGLEKKLITTNSNIRNFDFFRPQNIHIIDDINNINLPSVFYNSSFNSLPPIIQDKYYLKNWIKTIIS